MTRKMTWTDVESLIRQHKPTIDDQTLQSALRELQQALDTHKAVDLGTEKMTSEELRQLGEAFATVQSSLENLTPSGIKFVSGALDGPIGALLSTVRKVNEAIEQAISPRGRPPKLANALLAQEVARILDQVLEIKPALSRAEDRSASNKRGAAFEKLLALILKIGDIYVPEDLYPLMKSGVKLLKNPRGDFL
jgi:hypothetical protein